MLGGSKYLSGKLNEAHIPRNLWAAFCLETLSVGGL